MAIDSNRFSIRADWYDKTMKHLLRHSTKGLVILNDFAKDKLFIDPADVEQGTQFDRFLQGLEDRNLIFYKVSELEPNGKDKDRRCLNTVEFSAILQNEGWLLMKEISNRGLITILTGASILLALAALGTSVTSVIIQANDSTDTELRQLNLELQKHRQILQTIPQSQREIDATLHQIRDSL